MSMALLGDGSVWAWGVNDLGQAGDGTTTERATPLQNGVTNAVQIAMGEVLKAES